MYKILLTKQAEIDKQKIKQVPALKNNVERLISLIRENPWQNPPAYEALVGNLKGLYSRRINQKHRLVYRVDEADRIVVVASMWSHYENL